MPQFLLLIIAFLGATVQFFTSKEHRSRERMTELLLKWLFALPMGVWALIAAYFHVFHADLIARSIGWPEGNPFQFEIAMANLALGITGLLAVQASRGFRWATWTSLAVLYWGAAVGHIRQIIVAGNQAENNAGMILYMDIFVPIVIGLVLFMNSRQK